MQRLIDSLAQQYKDHLSHILVYRRPVNRQALERREWPMSQLKMEIKEVVEELGIAMFIEELGISRVIEEVGLAKVVKEIGLAKVIEEAGLDDVERAVEQLKRERNAKTRPGDS